MEQSGEFRTQSLKDRLKARFEYTFKPTGPVSKEVIRQIRKIQNVIPYGAAWEAFEMLKKDVPAKMKETDDRFRSESFWHTAKNVVNLIFFYSPLVVWLTGGRNPAAEERKKIKRAAQEWKRHLTTPEGKHALRTIGGPAADRRVDSIVARIIAGEPPEHPAKSVPRVPAR